MKSYEVRRREADARNAAWRELSPAEQLAVLKQRGFTAGRQVERLRRKIRESHGN